MNNITTSLITPYGRNYTCKSVVMKYNSREDNSVLFTAFLGISDEAQDKRRQLCITVEPV